MTVSESLLHIDAEKTPAEILERLGKDHKVDVARASALLERTDNMTTVDDDKTEGIVADYIKGLRAVRKDLEAHRVAEKTPFDDCSAAVHGFFKQKLDKIDARGKALGRLITAYQNEKAAAERRRLMEEERKRREEEERARKEAEELAALAETDDDLEVAILAEEEAQDATVERAHAEKASSRKAAELSRARTESGAVASLRTEWRHDEASVKREELDLEVLRPYFTMNALHAAIRAAIKAGHHDIAGVEINEEQNTVVR